MRETPSPPPVVGFSGHSASEPMSAAIGFFLCATHLRMSCGVSAMVLHARGVSPQNSGAEERSQSVSTRFNRAATDVI